MDQCYSELETHAIELYLQSTKIDALLRCVLCILSVLLLELIRNSLETIHCVMLFGFCPVAIKD